MNIRKLEEHESGKQADLTRELVGASIAYYNGEITKMSDIEFDKKVDELRRMEEESGIVYEGSPTQKVGAAVTSLKKVLHEQPALSLDKIKYADREDIKKWLGGRDAVMSWKCDGLTIVVTYENGKLVQAVTRGDGIEGRDITHNAKFFKGLPNKISFKHKVIVRGEAVMTFKEFERINAEENGVYENPRNLAAATVQMLDANESRKREICFKAFELVIPDVYVLIGEDDDSKNIDIHYNLQYMGKRLNWLSHLGFDVVDWCYATEPFGRTGEYEHTDDAGKIALTRIEEWKARLPELDYPTDGLVFTYNDLIEGWKLGSTGHHPRWAIALKWTDETVTTTIRDIEWSVGKTGIITPVAVFDTVRLGLGSNVTRASLHHLSIMKRLSDKTSGNVRSTMIIGSKAEVYLSNMIIPQIASIIKTDKTTAAQTPHRCPSCGEPTSVVWNPDNNVEVLMCTNHDKCPAQQIGRLMNTFSKDGLFVKGLGENILQDLIEEQLIDPMEGALTLFVMQKRVSNDVVMKSRYNRLLERDGWGWKKYSNLAKAIEEAKDTTLQKFLYSLNIPLLGNDLSKKLAKYWHNDIECFMIFLCGVDEAAGEYERYGYDRALKELTAIDGVGDEKARNIVNWAYNLVKDRDAYQRLLYLVEELHFPVSEPSTVNNSLKGLTFVITGSVHEYKNRDEFKASVEDRGGKVAGSVSKNTTALINNDVDSTSGKNQKAKELGIEIISEDEFISRYGK